MARECSRSIDAPLWAPLHQLHEDGQFRASQSVRRAARLAAAQPEYCLPRDVIHASRSGSDWICDRQETDGALSAFGRVLSRGCGHALKRYVHSSMLVRASTVSDARRIAYIHVETWRAAYRGQMPDAVLDALDVERRTANASHKLQVKCLLLRTVTVSLASAPSSHHGMKMLIR